MLLSHSIIIIEVWKRGYIPFCMRIYAYKNIVSGVMLTLNEDDRVCVANDFAKKFEHCQIVWIAL